LLIAVIVMISIISNTTITTTNTHRLLGFVVKLFPSDEPQGSVAEILYVTGAVVIATAHIERDTFVTIQPVSTALGLPRQT